MHGDMARHGSYPTFGYILDMLACYIEIIDPNICICRIPRVGMPRLCQTFAENFNPSKNPWVCAPSWRLGFVPQTSLLWGPGPSLVLASTAALLESRSFAASTWPLNAAKWSDVLPQGCGQLISRQTNVLDSTPSNRFKKEDVHKESYHKYTPNKLQYIFLANDIAFNETISRVQNGPKVYDAQKGWGGVKSFWCHIFLAKSLFLWWVVFIFCVAWTPETCMDVMSRSLLLLFRLPKLHLLFTLWSPLAKLIRNHQ